MYRIAYKFHAFCSISCMIDLWKAYLQSACNLNRWLINFKRITSLMQCNSIAFISQPNNSLLNNAGRPSVNTIRTKLDSRRIRNEQRNRTKRRVAADRERLILASGEKIVGMKPEPLSKCAVRAREGCTEFDKMDPARPAITTTNTTTWSAWLIDSRRRRVLVPNLHVHAGHSPLNGPVGILLTGERKREKERTRVA